MRSATSLAIAAAMAGALVLQTPASAQDKPAYIGVEACGKCHKRETTGNQLGQWQQSKHAKAFATLGTPKAKELAAAKGIADPQKDGKCLKCHVTAYGVDAALIVVAATPEEKGFVAEEGVQCESCHGPGSLYKPRKIMKDKTAAVAAGLIVPDEKLCKTCHNPESPSYKEFNYAEAKKKIEHPNPNKGKAEAE
jgi:cytochrome c553